MWKWNLRRSRVLTTWRNLKMDSLSLVNINIIVKFNYLKLSTHDNAAACVSSSTTTWLRGDNVGLKAITTHCVSISRFIIVNSHPMAYSSRLLCKKWLLMFIQPFFAPCTAHFCEREWLSMRRIVINFIIVIASNFSCQECHASLFSP